MQTLRDSAIGARVASIVAACALIAPLAGCSAPHLEARNADAARLGTCESAYLAASDGTPGLSDAYAQRPALMRYLLSRTAGEAWLTVAASCTGRFAEGALRSAQVSAVTQRLGGALGIASPTPPTVDYGDVVALDAAPAALDAISLAEDRAGFSIEVLAARGARNATLAASDNHKTAAQRLFSLSGSTDDPRRKVYAVDELLAHPDTIEDPATGVTANTVAVIEMNCARAYLDAIGGADDEDTGDAASDTTDAAETSDATRDTTGTSDTASEKTLHLMARMAAARAWHAMELGYPTGDAALFR